MPEVVQSYDGRIVIWHMHHAVGALTRLFYEKHKGKEDTQDTQDSGGVWLIRVYASQQMPRADLDKLLSLSMHGAVRIYKNGKRDWTAPISFGHASTRSSS
jgi:hypothetical protein